MIRIEFHDSTNTMTMRIAGRFVETLAENARALISPCTDLPKFIVNLSEVSFVDTVGEKVLSWFGQLGGEFVAENSYSLNVCERLNLPISRNQGFKLRLRTAKKSSALSSVSSGTDC